MIVRTKFIMANTWNTVESYWNVSTKLAFLLPAGAKIRLRYGGGWFAKNRQQQTLTGQQYKELVVSRWSIFVARAQVCFTQDTNITYYADYSNLANLPPEGHF
jgi:hypothetical protein